MGQRVMDPAVEIGATARLNPNVSVQSSREPERLVGEWQNQMTAAGMKDAGKPAGQASAGVKVSPVQSASGGESAEVEATGEKAESAADAPVPSLMAGKVRTGTTAEVRKEVAEKADGLAGHGLDGQMKAKHTMKAEAGIDSGNATGAGVEVKTQLTAFVQSGIPMQADAEGAEKGSGPAVSGSPAGVKVGMAKAAGVGGNLKASRPKPGEGDEGSVNLPAGRPVVAVAGVEAPRRHSGDASAGAAITKADGESAGVAQMAMKEAQLNPAGATGAVVQPQISGHGRTGTGLGTQETVSTPSVDDPRVMASGPARLDVGVYDGTHGWLRIRAELGAGGAVSASLTASAVAHESLRAAVPEMAKYLQTEAVSVSRIAVHGRTEGAGGSGTGSAEGQAKSGSGGNGEAAKRELSGEGADVTTVEGESVLGTVSGTGNVGMMTRASGWAAGIFAATPGFGGIGGGSGMWLNVSA